MLRHEVFLGPLKITLLPDCLGCSDNVHAEVFVVLLSCLLDHHHRVLEVKVVVHEVIDHILLLRKGARVV